MKKFLRLAVVALLLLLLFLGGLFYFRNDLIKNVVEGAGPLALGVETPLEAVRTDLGSGDFALVDYRIENPEGFSDEPVFALGNASMKLPLMALRGEEELRIPEVRVESLAVRLERNDSGFNFQPLIDHINELTASDDSAEPGGSEEPGEPAGDGPAPDAAPARPIVIEKLVLADWTLALDFGGAWQLPATGLDTLVLENVRTDGQGLPGLLGQVVEQLLAYVQDEGLEAIGLGALDPELVAQIDALRTALDEGLDVDALRAELEGEIDEELNELERSAQERLDELREQTQGQIEAIVGEATGGALPPEAAAKLDELLQQADGVELPASLKEDAKKLLDQATGEGGDTLEDLEKKAKETLGGLLGGSLGG